MSRRKASEFYALNLKKKLVKDLVTSVVHAGLLNKNWISPVQSTFNSFILLYDITLYYIILLYYLCYSFILFYFILYIHGVSLFSLPDLQEIHC